MCEKEHAREQVRNTVNVPRVLGYMRKETVCCSVLQCVAVCCSVLQCIAVYCSVLQCVALCCSILSSQKIANAPRVSESQMCVAVCCSA